MSDSVGPHRQQPSRLPHPWDSPGKNTGVGCHFLLQCRKVKSKIEVAQSCPTLSDPMDCSLSGSFVHGIFQARVLEWDAIAFSDQSILEEINSEYSLEGLMLKLQYFGHLTQGGTQWTRNWFWDILRAEGERVNRGWDDGMTSPTQRMWVWANSGR